MLYYLYQISKDAKHSQLTRWEMVELLKKHSDHSDWVYWTPSEKNWVPVHESQDVKNWIEMSESFLQAPPALPSFKTSPLPSLPEQGITINNNSEDNETHFEVIISDEPAPKAPPMPAPVVTPAVASVAPVAPSESRKYPRVLGRLRTIITNKNKAFITYSVDISLGGVQVEHSIPQDVLTGDLEIYVSDPHGKKSLLFNCQVIGDRTNSKRFSFAKLEKEQSQKLSHWIDQLSAPKVS